MGELILCSHSIAAMPYYIDSVSLNIYSLEELCYHMEEHLYLIEPDFMNEDLCSWIERELGDRKLASALRNVLRKIHTAYSHRTWRDAEQIRI